MSTAQHRESALPRWRRDRRLERIPEADERRETAAETAVQREDPSVPETGYATESNSISQHASTEIQSVIRDAVMQQMLRATDLLFEAINEAAFNAVSLAVSETLPRAVNEAISTAVAASVAETVARGKAQALASALASRPSSEAARPFAAVHDFGPAQKPTAGPSSGDAEAGERQLKKSCLSSRLRQRLGRRERKEVSFAATQEVRVITERPEESTDERELTRRECQVRRRQRENSSRSPAELELLGRMVQMDTDEMLQRELSCISRLRTMLRRGLEPGARLSLSAGRSCQQHPEQRPEQHPEQHPEQQSEQQSAQYHEQHPEQQSEQQSAQYPRQQSEQQFPAIGEDAHADVGPPRLTADAGLVEFPAWEDPRLDAVS